MSSTVNSPAPGGRRQVLAAFVGTIIGAIGASLGAVLGLFALKPSASAASERWIHAGTLSDLTESRPTPRVISVPQLDGWYRGRARRTVFVVWDGQQQVRALSATCTHLGCQVAWDAAAGQFKCPCHGGIYDAHGQVVSGPPPRPLEVLTAEIRNNADVLVKL